MNIRQLCIIALFLLTACGGGGGGGGAAPTVIGGVASKGIIVGGTVTVYALNADGSKTVLRKDIPTDSNGRYSADVGGYAGPVVVEVWGDYTDEATGAIKHITQGEPLRAALSSVSGNVALSVTPLTDLAVRQAGTLTAQKILAANKQISEIFKVDITATAPVATTAQAFQSSQTTQAQKDYSLALAAISQQMKTGTQLSAVLDTLQGGITDTGLSEQAAHTFTTSVSEFIANDKNQTGVASIADTSLKAVGLTTVKLVLVLEGNAAACKGLQTVITLPAGVTMRADTSGQILDGAIVAAGSASGGYLTGRYAAATQSESATITLALTPAGTLAAGAIVEINADIAPGSAVPLLSGFTVDGGQSNFSGEHGVELSGMVLSLMFKI